MSEAQRKFLIGLTLLLLGGLLLGWFYDRPMAGFLAAALVALAWQIRQLFVFDKALRTLDFDELRFGEGIWSQMYARIDYLLRRGQKNKKRYRQLLKEVRNSTNAMPDGAVVLSRDFEIVLCNAASQDLAGFRPRQDRRQRVDNILRDPAFTAYLRSGNFDRAVEIQSPLLEGHWLNCRIVPFGANQRLLLIRDVTERIRLNKMRREFVANASHELRSPLTVITGYLDALVTDPDAPAEWKKPVAEMQRQADRMTNIVSELLELSRLEAAGSEVSDNERIDVCGLFATAQKGFAGQDGVPTINIDCQSRAALLGSVLEIESVISNLLSNAIRHTPASGTVTLTWSVDAREARLSVTDTGEGVDVQDIPRLTERFFRVNRGRSREDGGIGLGLAIVKHALSRHGAELTVSSQLGKGSTFTCHFPSSRLAGADVTPLKQDGGKE